MTFRELQDLTLRELGYNPASVAEEPRSRIKDRLNSWHRRLLTEPGLSRYLRDAYTFTLTTASGRGQYGLPQGVERIIAIRDASGESFLSMLSLNDIRRGDPGLSSTGDPSAWALMGQYPVHRQPSDASILALKSSSASDTAVVVLLEYLNSSGRQIQTTVTLNGATEVTVGTNVVEVVNVRLSSAPVGNVSVYEDSTVTGTEIGYIPAGSQGVTHWHILLWPEPSSAIDLSVDATRRLTDLSRDHDEPMLPRDFHDVLSLAAQSDEWRRKGELERSQLVRSEYEQRKRDLVAWTWNLPAYLPGESSDIAGSRLGPWYPQGS